MDSWDSESSAVAGPKMPADSKSGKWEGEDEDEDVVENWDQDDELDEVDEDEPDEVDSPLPTTTKVVITKKNAKKIGEKFEEKERKKQFQQSGKPDEDRLQTPEEKLAEKLKQRKLQEESDLNLAKEVFGVVGTSVLSTKEDFDKLKEELLNVISDCVKNSNYVTFSEDIVHSLCIHLPSSDIKKIHTWLGNLHIEKSKLEKGDRSRKTKGKGKAKLKMEGDNDFTELSSYTEDFEDFI